jgi:uncharacterized protein
LIVFCDTSALLKLYLTEPGHELARAALTQADDVAVSAITWVESLSAFARRDRDYPAKKGENETARALFRRGWDGFVSVDASQEVLSAAGECVSTYGLRAYDGLQLASALTFQKLLGMQIAFASFDRRLNEAAEKAGLLLVKV